MLRYILSTLFLLPSFITAYPNPICDNSNGQCEGQIHDPSVVMRNDGTYFRFSTSDGINIATASNIGGPWTHQGSVLPQGSVIKLPGNHALWAPDCFGYDGLYYLYYAVSVSGSKNSDIGLATSTTMEPGSWTDHGSIGIPPQSYYNKIDPNLFHSPSGAFSLSFGSYWAGIYQVPMTTPPTKVNGAAVHLEQNTTVRPDNLPGDPNEASFQFWYNVDGTVYYYLFFSSGTCCNTPPNLVPNGEEYKVLVCRSTRSNGGFVDKNGRNCLTGNGGTLVLASHDDVYAPGGQGVINLPSLNSVVMYYHYVKPSVGYNFKQFFFGYNKLDFSSGWPVLQHSSA